MTWFLVHLLITKEVCGILDHVPGCVHTFDSPIADCACQNGSGHLRDSEVVVGVVHD